MRFWLWFSRMSCPTVSPARLVVVAEPLEARIAPALYFLSGSAMLGAVVTDDKGTVVSDGVAASSVGATTAVLLKAGDSLVLDTDGDHVLDMGEVTYLKVTGGKAMVFATDLNASTSFSANEITGVAVSDGFKGVIEGDVNGDIGTLLDKDGQFTKTTLQDASIAGVTVSGRITGNLSAGKNISHVVIGADATGTGFGVSKILVGSQASEDGFNFSGEASESFTPGFDFVKAGEAGGSIGDVTVYKGAQQIFAGTGSSVTKGKGGQGGSISKLTLIDAVAEYEIRGGNGGSSTAAKGIGGTGGAVTDVKATFTTASAKPIDTGVGKIAAGNGGDGYLGGQGGALNRINFKYQTDVLHWFYFNGGGGGVATAGGSGGNGGAATNIAVTGTGLVDFVGIYGGYGTNAGINGNGRGGTGGKVQHATYSALGGQYAPYATSGNGGDGVGTGNGGASGAVDDVVFTMGNTRAGEGVVSGSGGDSPMGIGGASGAVSRIHITAGTTTNQTRDGALFLGSGEAGIGGKQGGASGSVSNSSITATGTTADGIQVYTSTGGVGAKGGASGKISNVTITHAGSNSEISIIGSNGGEGTSGDGGAAGSISGAKITATSGTFNLMKIQGGQGGTGLGKNGGKGGAVSASSIAAAAGVTGNKLEITGGAGGLGTHDGLGGAGGSVTASKLSAATALTGDATVRAGAGGSSQDEGGRGGASGAVTNLQLALPDSVVFVLGGNANSTQANGGTGKKSAGGAGGAITGVTGSVGTLIATAGYGGSAVDGKGGAGGNISGIKLTAVSDFVRIIKAGDGGSGAIASKGGSISNVKVPGDIGDFSSNFGINSTSNTGMGGLVSGLGGQVTGGGFAANGGISGISATRIAAILAGAPGAWGTNGLTELNAVSKISGLKDVTKIGADVNTDTMFTFTDSATGPNPANNQFLLGDGDTAIDGLVIVAKGKFLSTVVSLKKIEVG